MASFSMSVNISRVDSDHSRYEARGRSLPCPARNLNRELLLANFSVSLSTAKISAYTTGDANISILHALRRYLGKEKWPLITNGDRMVRRLGNIYTIFMSTQCWCNRHKVTDDMYSTWWTYVHAALWWVFVHAFYIGVYISACLKSVQYEPQLNNSNSAYTRV